MSTSVLWGMWTAASTILLPTIVLSSPTPALGSQHPLVPNDISVRLEIDQAEGLPVTGVMHDSMLAVGRLATGAPANWLRPADVGRQTITMQTVVKEDMNRLYTTKLAVLGLFACVNDMLETAIYDTNRIRASNCTVSSPPGREIYTVLFRRKRFPRPPQGLGASDDCEDTGSMSNTLLVGSNETLPLTSRDMANSSMNNSTCGLTADPRHPGHVATATAELISEESGDDFVRAVFSLMEAQVAFVSTNQQPTLEAGFTYEYTSPGQGYKVSLRRRDLLHQSVDASMLPRGLALLVSKSAAGACTFVLGVMEYIDGPPLREPRRFEAIDGSLIKV